MSPNASSNTSPSRSPRPSRIAGESEGVATGGCAALRNLCAATDEAGCGRKKRALEEALAKLKAQLRAAAASPRGGISDDKARQLALAVRKLTQRNAELLPGLPSTSTTK